MPKFNLSYNRLYQIREALAQHADKPGAHFGVFVAENIDRMNKRIDLFTEQFAPSDSFVEVAKNIESEDPEADVIERMKEKHPKLWKAREKQLNKMSEEAQEETEMNLLTISAKNMPALTAAEIMQFKELVSMPED